jgi:flagellar biosynthetic protein FliS
MDSNTLQRLQREYLESRILSAHPIEIVSMLYQVAIDHLKAAIENLKTGGHFARSRAVTRAEQAVHELLIALDHSVDAPFTRTSADLYQYVLERIVTGHAKKSEQAFREALAVLTPLAAAWTDLKTRMAEEPSAKGAVPDAAPEEPRPTAEDPYAAYRQKPGVAASRDWSC